MVDIKIWDPSSETDRIRIVSDGSPASRGMGWPPAVFETSVTVPEPMSLSYTDPGALSSPPGAKAMLCELKTKWEKSGDGWISPSKVLPFGMTFRLVGNLPSDSPSTFHRNGPLLGSISWNSAAF